MEARRILVAVSGGIAAYKVPELVRILRRAGHAVSCILTPEAEHFVTPWVLQALTGQPARSRLFDAREEGQIGHIELADWAEAVVVAPATAHTLARMAHGLADDLVTTVLLATRAPVLVAPAMNLHMWSHAATRANCERLHERGVGFVGPESGELACGWEGDGRMAEPVTIAGSVERLLGPRTLDAERVMVTAGGTREPLDPVRALANRSSGKMGFAVAAEAARRGAEVVLVSGPSALPTPPGARRVDVETALEMREAVRSELPRATVVVMAAAVSDFRPARPVARKIRKEDLGPERGLTLELVPNPDILAEVCRDKGARLVIGFAAESHDAIESARRKLARKGCDLMVVNDVSRPGSGFDVDTNAVSFLWPGGEVEALPQLRKSEVAAQLWDRVEKRRGERA